MPSNTDVRKTLTDPTPLYFAAGLIEKVRTEAPERIAKLREADTKALQGRVQEALASLDSDLRKWREQAQQLALQGVGYAAEAAVKAKENYDTLAEQGKVAVDAWWGRGQDDGGWETKVEREPFVAQPPSPEPAGKARVSGRARPEEPKADGPGTADGAAKPEQKPETKKAAPKATGRTTAKTVPKRTTATTRKAAAPEESSDS
ncbi:hypothetical protein [Streptomyces sp. WMMC897]|uniref:hypothetical protein n=1 Tax=Streptomyces sp. WMMC897 TaxID=3014782 RepID=UPI0022B6C511|nr:hypothetical protein [Streptomyces sp. WMMC897]MCZ7417462.1 hypothetical protein [Streptomyces sp. WMMC897]